MARISFSVALALVAVCLVTSTEALSIRGKKNLDVYGRVRQVPTGYSTSDKWGAPPAPRGELPEPEGDKAYKDKDAACAACKCHATNVAGASNNVDDAGTFGDGASDQSSWHWACGNAAGDKYGSCFPSDGSKYTDNFGEKIDPNNPVCP